MINFSWILFSDLMKSGGWVLYPILAVAVTSFYIGLGIWFRILDSKRAYKIFNNGGVPKDAKAWILLIDARRNNNDRELLLNAYRNLISYTNNVTKKGLSTMIAFVVISPLLGLLGTISGMNEMFAVIGEFGFGSPTILSSAISTALEATLTGLGVAVAVLFFHHFLDNRRESLLHKISKDCKNLTGIEPDFNLDKDESMNTDYRLVQQESHNPDINLAPFVDTIMILLIFFVVTANLYIETGVDVSRPKAQTAKTVGQKSMLVGVTREGTIHVYGRQISVDRLRLLVEHETTKQPDISVVIIADRDASVGKTVEVMDQCSMGGAQKISVAASSKEGSQ